MAFCNSCGTNLQAGAKFCPKCGAAVPAAAATTVPSAPGTAVPAQPNQGSNALKIVLIVVAIVVGLGILAIGSLSFVAWRIARHSHIHTRDGNVHVETPFGTVETSDDPQLAARNIGIDVYPGAVFQKDGSANVSLGGMHTTAVNFETDDPASKVADFYRNKFPNANFTSANGVYSIVSGDKDNVLTITIEEQDEKTQVHIAKVTK